MEGRVNCTLCGTGNAVELFRAVERRFGLPGQFSVVRCGQCGLQRTEPQPDDIGAYYPPGEYYSYLAPSVPAVTSAIVLSAYRQSAQASLPVRIAARLGSGRLGGLPPGPPGAVLDVGCGSGAMLLALQRAGWEPHGVEMDAAAVVAAQSVGLRKVRVGELLTAGYEAESFDVVRFWHSLEHLRSPRAALDEARRILRPGGHVVIGVPNAHSLLARVFRDRWFYLDVPRHLWHFHAAVLVRLVSSVGFRIRRLRQVTSGSAILGTLDYVRGARETLVNAPAALYAAQPLAMVLDALGVGDELERIAQR